MLKIAGFSNKMQNTYLMTNCQPNSQIQYLLTFMTNEKTMKYEYQIEEIHFIEDLITHFQNLSDPLDPSTE